MCLLVGERSPKSSTIFLTSEWAVLTVASVATTMPIRTVSPGLTVYRGGAVMPRYQRVRQSFGNLSVTRDIWQLNVSYTPTPQLQLEAELPYVRTRAQQVPIALTNSGFGNLRLWGKYRFFRTVEQ